MTQFSSQDQERLKQLLMEYIGCSCEESPGGDSSEADTGNKIVFRPSSIPEKKCFAERYEYIMSHLPLGDWLPRYHCINLSVTGFFERLSYVLSGRLYFISPAKPAIPNNLSAFIEELRTTHEKAQMLFDDHKQNVTRICPKLESILEEIQDNEDITLEQIMEQIRTQKPLRQIEEYRIRDLYFLNAFVQQSNVHISLLEATDYKLNSVFGVAKQVISKFRPAQIPIISGRYVRLLRKIIQIKPLIEPETSVWAMQYPRGIKAAIKLFD
jgi:hypothetical protein